MSTCLFDSEFYFGFYVAEVIYCVVYICKSVNDKNALLDCKQEEAKALMRRNLIYMALFQGSEKKVLLPNARNELHLIVRPFLN